MTKTITNKAITFIVAFAMIFTAFSFAESVYAAPNDIEVINDIWQDYRRGHPRLLFTTSVKIIQLHTY